MAKFKPLTVGNPKIAKGPAFGYLNAVLHLTLGSLSGLIAGVSRLIHADVAADRAVFRRRMSLPDRRMTSCSRPGNTPPVFMPSWDTAEDKVVPGLAEIPLRAMSDARETHGDILALTRGGRWVVVAKSDGFAAFYAHVNGRLAYESAEEYAELFTFKQDELSGWIALPQSTERLFRQV